MQNQQADFAEIRRINHISLNFPWNLCSRLALKIALSADAAPVDSEKPECYRRANLRGSPQKAVPVEMCILC
jgi:hypothetical protein